MKQLRVWLVVCMSMMMLAGSAAAEVTLNFWTQEGEADGGFQFVQKLVNGFMEQNPDVKINLVTKDTEVLREDYQTASLAGDAPDLLWTVSDQAGPFTKANLLQPMDELFDLGVFVDSAIAGVQLDGKTWGVPVANGNHLMLMYNKTLVPNAPQNTDEMIEIAKKLTVDGKYGIAWNQMEPFWMVPWLGGFGGKVFAADGVTPNLNTKEMIATLQFFKDLKLTHKVIPNESDYAGADTLFKEGTAAMTVNGDWSLGDYKKVLGENFAVAPLPMISATQQWPAPYTSGKFLMLSAGIADDKLEAAMKFIDFVTNLDNQLDLIKTLSRLPALKEALASELVTGDPILKGSAEQMTKGTPMPIVLQMRCNWDAMKPELNAVMADKKSPEEAAVDMQKAAEACVQTIK